MTDMIAPDNQKTRRWLAPHLGPVHIQEPADGSRPLYLSWAGWELYLTRRLDLTPAERAAADPVLLPDLTNPDRDFAAIDQLVRSAGELGAGILSLRPNDPDSFADLTSAILRGQGRSGGPILDDRSYLALWTSSEFQVERSRRLLARAAERERAMWAALKGEGEPSPAPSVSPPPAETDRRAAYAWQCWRRLVGPLLGPDDILIPTAPDSE